MKQRTETQENNFGVKFQLGQKFTLYKKFGKNEGVDCSISQISPSGMFFKVNKSNLLFSIKTLNSKGSTISSGCYVSPK